MPHDWAVMDKLIRELGSLRLDAETAEREIPEARKLAEAVDRASTAVHQCLNDEAADAIVAAWEALEEARGQLLRARQIIETARQARERTAGMRRRAAILREADDGH
jgi:hypothetical protein